MSRAGYCIVYLSAALLAGGCTNSQASGSSTTGGATTGASSSGGQTSSGGGATGGASTGPSTSNGSSSGTGTTGGSTGGSTTGTSSSSTGTPPYQGFDAGPRWEPPIDIDAGCCAGAPFPQLGGPGVSLGCPSGGNCTMCRNDADCPPGRFCNSDPDFDGLTRCEGCRPLVDAGPPGCPSSEVCVSPTFEPHCIPDCRDGGVTCTPGLCSSENGICLPGQCLQDSDCDGFTGDGGGVCDTSLGAPGLCAGCFADGGGCTGVADLCDSTAHCAQNCIDGGYLCPPSSFCSTNGRCSPGCRKNGDCGGATPFCQTTYVPPSCAACIGAADCPGWTPGCTGLINFDGTTSPNVCDLCYQDHDCPQGLHCKGGFCGCNATSECSALFPNQPICIPTSDGGGASNGACGCRSSADCVTGMLCETRPPYQIAFFDTAKLGYFFLGGVCIPSCLDAGASYCEDSVGLGNKVCDPGTGYCVPCEQNGDCTAGLSPPFTKPECISFPDGNYPNALGNLPLLTSGGQCGCSTTASCGDGLTCGPGWYLNPAGLCEAPCTVENGGDSCSLSTTGSSFCNTQTGLCQQCIDDYDCIGMTRSTTIAPSVPFGTCTSSGSCVQCTDGSQCPATTPGCSDGQCGFCGDAADCPADAGYLCTSIKGAAWSSQCLAPCLLGDDAGMGTVSDAGPTCPALLPYCVVAPTAPPASWCSQCRSATDCPSGQLCCGTFCWPGRSCPI